MARSWNILVVDDEEDVHTITKLSLKNRTWNDREFNIIAARSAAEARQLLEGPKCPELHVALVDCVMETNQAGLELCDYLRKKCAASLRIVLRTGQPGVAPEEKILNDYDIDYYLAKSDATDKRLFATIRASLRTGQEISTLLVVDEQLKGLTRAIRRAESVDELGHVMAKSLKFLNEKFDCRGVFFADVDRGVESACPPANAPGSEQIDYGAIQQALLELHKQTDGQSGIIEGTQFGLSQHAYLRTVAVLEGADRKGGHAAPSPAAEAAPAAQDKGRFSFFGKKDKAPTPAAAAPAPTARPAGTSIARNVRGGVFIEFSPDSFTPKARDTAFTDIDRFIENWQIAYSVLCLLDDQAHVMPARHAHQSPTQTERESATSLDNMAKRRAGDLWQTGVRAAQENRVPEAVAAFQKALAFDPAHAETHRSYGRVLYKMGKREEAADHFRTYLDLAPDADDSKEIANLITECGGD